MKKAVERLMSGATRLLVLALTLLVAGSVLAYASAGDLFEWNNLSASGTHNQSNTDSKWTITLNATEDVPNGSVVSVTNISICSRNTAATLQSNDPRYLKIGDVFSEVVNGDETVSGETLTAGSSSYPKLSFDFSEGVALTVGETYDMYLYNTGKASATESLGAKLVQSNDSKSSLVMTAQGGGYYPLSKITGSVVSTTPVYEASPSGTSVSFSELSWTLNGNSVVLPADLSSSVISVTLDDGAVLSLDAGITALSFNVSGASATLDYDATKSFSVSAWDFSGLTGVITFRDFPDVLSDAKVTLAAGGVRLEGSDTLSYLPYMASAQTKHVDIAQPVSITSGDGAYFKFAKSDYHFSGTGESTFARFAMGNKNASSDNADQTITQDSGTITVTGNNPPSSSSTASILLAHWGSTCVLNTLGGTFNANNAAVRLGWDGSATWNIGGGSSAATVNTSGISNGENGHSGAGTLNIKDNGTLNLGDYGVKMPGTVGTINLGGGTIKATADTSIANGKAAGTILNSGKVTTFNTQGHTMTLSAQLSGAGQLTKEGAGDLIITGIGTATGKTVINGGKVVLSGNEAKVGTGTFELKGGNLEIAPGANNTITLAPQFVVNSSDAYQSDGSGPNIYVGPGTVVINATGSSANGHFAQSIINIADGGDLQLTRGDLLGYNFTIPVNIAAGGKLTVSKRETFTRKLYLNGGSVYIVKNEADGRSLDLHGGQQTYVTADSSIDAATDSATIWIRNSNATMNVNDSATLSLNAIVAEGESGAGAVGRGITKTGAGTLKLTKANTATGTLAVNAGTLQLDGGSWTGPVTIAEGASLDIVTDTEFSYGDTIVTLNSGSTISGAVKINGVAVPVTVSSGVVTFTPAASVTTTSGTSYHSSIEAAFGVFGTAVASDETAAMNVLDGTDLSGYVSAFVTAGYYYDSAAGTVTKAVAKTSANSYNSLASAVADVASGTTIELLRASSEAITLDKAITLSETANFSGTLTGTGTLTFAEFRNNPSITFDGWTGSVVLPSFTAGGTILNRYGVTGSTVVLKGITSGWLGETSSQRMDVNPVLQLDGNVTITGFSQSWTYTFAEITGTGTFSLDPTDNHPNAASITKVAAGFSGSIYSDIATTLTIGTIDLEGETLVTGGMKLLTTSGSGDVTASALTVGDVAQSATLCTESDGIYVVAASVQKGEDTPTIHTTVAAAMTEAGSDAATITLLANTSSDIALAVGQSLVTGGFSVGTVSTGATYYHVVNNAGVYTVVLDTYTITVPSVANATATATISGEPVSLDANGQAAVPAGSVVTVTYTANEGYALSGTAQYTIDTASATTFVITDTATAKYVASITVSDVTTKYTSLQAAIDAVVNQNQDIALLAIAGGATVSREVTFNVVPGEYTYGDVVASGNYILTVTALEGKTKYSFAPAVIAVTVNEVRTLYPMMTANAGIEAANAGPIGTTIEILSGDPASYAAYLPMFDLENGVFTKVADPVAAVYQGLIQQQVYRTLAEAVAAAEAGQTVKLLVNVSLDAAVAISKTLTLDLNGYAITASDINAITTSGALSVQGSSGSINVTSGGSVVLTDAAATLTVSGVTLSPTPTTTVANSYVKLDGSTYLVDAYNTVSFTAPNATVTRTDALGNAIKDGDTITFTVTPEVGYAVTAVAVTSGSGEVTGSGPYSYIVTGVATITVTAVSTSLTIGSGTVSYYASYTNATVTASVTGTVLEGTTFTLSGTGISGEYTGTYSAGTVTFNDVHGYKLGDTINYTITAAGTSTGSYSEPSFTVGSVPASDNWMLWDKTHTAVGSWKDGNGTSVPLNYGGETYADFTGTNTYMAAWMSTGEVVTVTTNVKFGDVADPAMTVDADAQAAVRIGAGNVFQVYAGSTPDWVNVYNDELGSPDGDDQYGVTVKLNYSTQTYGVDITKEATTYPLTNATHGATFPLAKASSAMQKVSYLGAGSFISLSGQYVSAGYTADVGTGEGATNVVVSSDFVNTYMSDKLASEISDLLDPNATKETKPNAIAANGYNYFTSYALGLDPTEDDDKVIVDVTTDDSGNFVFIVKHPVFDGDGNITGYAQVTEAANVTTTVTLKYGTSTDSIATVETGSAEGISPVDMFNHAGVGNVLYYKAEVTIGGK